MQIFRATEEECLKELRQLSGTKTETETGTETRSGVYRKAYCLRVVAGIKKYGELKKEAEAVLMRVFEEEKGRGLFLSGEVTEILKAHLNLKTRLDTDKEYFREILQVPIREGRVREEPEKKAFEELEPLISDKMVRDDEKRGGRGQEKKRAKEQRKKGRKSGQAQVVEKRREDREYAVRMKRLDRELRKQ
ncbi:hypothetical protein NEDG_00953 [Nematocida displodere]|uniref:Uncharacterized protein n=1 Tax=Nematocida displodere TaxID=1805483 RepID=A0A177EA44_9MICR|nr:hypothetical protein NEDG_00953 [Nematocida displodere]